MSIEDNPRNSARIEDEVTPVFFTFTHFIYFSPKTGGINLADVWPLSATNLNCFIERFKPLKIKRGYPEKAYIFAISNKETWD